MQTVISKDGTQIAYNKIGNGPAVILVDGAFCSKDFGPMVKIAPLLAENFTVYSYDRRGRGESTDARPYGIEREIEDLEALMTLAGGTAFVFGISSGAVLSINAAAAGLRIPKLALFEPPFVGNENSTKPNDAVQQLQAMIDQGKRGEAIKYYFRKVMGAPAIVPFIVRLTPNWPKMKMNAASLPYDTAICESFDIPTEQIVSIATPTLVIDSTKSPEALRNAVEGVSKAFPHGKRISLKGKPHDVPAEILVPVLTEFFQDK